MNASISCRIADSRSFSRRCPANEEIEDIGIAEDQVGSELVFLAQLLEFESRQFLRLPRERRALEEHGAHLVLQRALAPALNAAHLGIEIALERVGQVDNE